MQIKEMFYFMVTFTLMFLIDLYIFCHPFHPILLTPLLFVIGNHSLALYVELGHFVTLLRGRIHGILLAFSLRGRDTWSIYRKHTTVYGNE